MHTLEKVKITIVEALAALTQGETDRAEDLLMDGINYFDMATPAEKNDEVPSMRKPGSPSG